MTQRRVDEVLGRMLGEMPVNCDLAYTINRFLSEELPFIPPEGEWGRAALAIRGEGLRLSHDPPDWFPLVIDIWMGRA